MSEPVTSLDRYVEEFRKQPAFAKGQPVFLNSAGSSLPDPRVVERMVSYLTVEATIGGYEAAAVNEAETELFYARAAALIGADARDIAFVDSGTRAWNNIVYAGLGLEPGTEIITAGSEFGSNLTSLVGLAHQTGATLRLANVDERGAIDLEHLVSLVNDHTRLVAVSILNAHSGTINDLSGLAAQVRARSDKAVYLVDACQAAGHVPVNIADLDPDVLTVTGRKWLRGPRGTGFIYASPDTVARIRPAALDQVNAGLETPAEYPDTELSIRDDARRFETWERSTAAMLGLSQALAVVNELGIAETSAEIARLGVRLRSALVTIDGVQAHEPVDEPSGVVAVSTAAGPPWEVTGPLAAAGFSIGMMPRHEDGPAFNNPTQRSALRFSPHFFNTDEEVDQAAEALARILADLN